ncbi:MAG: hypothetical protein HYV97_16705 [Bdellovibrio sp.]|nr:hypothetical protein [Bdellovibrio sp.]
MATELLSKLVRFSFKAKHSKQEVPRGYKDFLKILSSTPLNHWCIENKILWRSIEELVENFSLEMFQFFGWGTNLVFLKSNGHFGCAIGATQADYLIIIFPNLLNFLHSAAPRIGQAILAHELGHLFNRHAEKSISPLQAQIEADAFAYRLGYGKELEQILLEQSGMEIQVRLAYLTSLWASDVKNHDNNL